MGNLTSGDIVIIVQVACAMVLQIYLKYDHLFSSTCCGGRGCAMSNSATSNDHVVEIPKE